MKLSIARVTRKRSVEANLFWAAQAAVQREGFRWHGGAMSDSYKGHSSQALTLDVFGSIQSSAHRDTILAALARELGLPDAGPWEILLEWHDPDNPLSEKQPTWADVVARSPQALVFMECKFTESDGGACSQTRPVKIGRNKGLTPCSGAYTSQTNPANGRTARCALSGKGIRYWDLIPEVFRIRADLGYLPCPFAGSWFQWMRNLVNCYASARRNGQQAAFLLVYAEGPGLPMAARVRTPDWDRLQRLVRSEAITFRAVSFQGVVEMAERAAGGDPTWPELRLWVDSKTGRVSEKKRPASDQRLRVRGG